MVYFITEKLGLMTVFDVKSEVGNARELRFEKITTPILLKTNFGVEDNPIDLNYYFLGDLWVFCLYSR